MKKVISLKGHPFGSSLSLIEGLLSVALIMWGAYLLSPVYDIETSSGAFSHAFQYPLSLAISAVVYLIIGALPIVGFLWGKHRLVSYGMGGVFMGYLYLALVRLISVGFQPIIWVFYIVLALIAAVCYLRERSDGR